MFILFRMHALVSVAIVAVALGGCQQSGPARTLFTAAEWHSDSPENRLHVLNRITWGPSVSSVRDIDAVGAARYIDQQLRPGSAVLPAAVQTQIDAMTISRRPLDQLLFELEQQRRTALAIAEPEERRAAQRAYQQELTRLAREAATRSLLRAVYSPNQLHERMTWFWMNHFSVYQFKANVRAMVGDYEENAVRPHALGRFRTLLGATVRHPAMLRYLDNTRNSANRINENYARELMELHTLGADGGYTQRDVQELARVLTGVGIALASKVPNVRADRQADYVRKGAFEFNPNRHDYGDKVFLGETVRGAGLAEIEEVLDRLARHPSTARFVSRKLAVHFVSDDPPLELVERMARTFQSSDGDIAATLRMLFTSAEFAAAPGRKFKDPVHYVISALRFTYDDKPISNALPVIAWLNRMGQGLYNRETPDGYPLTQAGWAAPGQMAARFEVARAIGSGGPALFGDAAAPGADLSSGRKLANLLYSTRETLSPATLRALEQARSAAEWNIYFLSSPDFMQR